MIASRQGVSSLLEQQSVCVPLRSISMRSDQRKDEIRMKRDNVSYEQGWMGGIVSLSPWSANALTVRRKKKGQGRK
jgi:hypothetical protein